MAGFDQMAQIFVGLRIGLPVMPGGDVQRADSGLRASAARNNRDRRASGRRNRRTPTGARNGTERSRPRSASACGEVGKALIAVRPGRRGDPQHRARASPESGDQRRFLPAFAREDAGLLAEFRTPADRAAFSQTMRSSGARRSSTLRTVTCCRRCAEAERGGQRRFAFEDQNRAVLDARRPFRGGGVSSMRRDHNRRARPPTRRSARSRRESPATIPGSSPITWKEKLAPRQQ